MLCFGSVVLISCLDLIFASFSLYIFLALAVCLFRGRVYVEGDRKSVHDSEGNCLLFECRVSTSVTAGQWSEDFQQIQNLTFPTFLFCTYFWRKSSEVCWVDVLIGFPWMMEIWILLTKIVPGPGYDLQSQAAFEPEFEFCLGLVMNLNFRQNKNSLSAWLQIWIPNNGWIPSKFLI